MSYDGVVLQAAVVFTAVSFVLLWAADLVSVEAGVFVVLVGAVVYTLGELTAGPVVAALSAEAAPSAVRGRYMAATQLAWSVAGAIGPLLWAFLLARGAWAAWGASLRALRGVVGAGAGARGAGCPWPAAPSPTSPRVPSRPRSTRPPRHPPPERQRGICRRDTPSCGV